MRLLICWLAVLTMLEPQPQGPHIRAVQGAVRGFDGEAGVYARNLGTGEEIAVHADTRFPTASVIKIAVMLEAFHQAAEDTLRLNSTIPLREADKVGGSGVLQGMSDGLELPIRDLVHLMIVLSDNTATNLLVNRLGTKNIDARLERYGLERTKIFRPTFRDGQPDIHPELEKEFGLGMATPREMGRLLALIAEGRAVNAEASAAMRAILGRQQDRAMIPRLLPGSARVANKTGTDLEKVPDARGHRGAIRADAAIVTSGETEYVLAVFTRRGQDTRGTVDNAGVLLGARVSKIVFDAWAGAATGR